jgi:hypothetical protein
MTPIENVLSRLTGVKRIGPNRWKANCSAHDDRDPSLFVSLTPEGLTLMKCMAGCETETVLHNIGLTFSDLFEKPLGHHFKPQRHPFPAADILQALAFEAKFLAVAARDLANGKPLALETLKRIEVAAQRFDAGLDAGRLR